VRWPDEGPTGSDEFFDLWVVTTLEILPRRADGLLGVEGEATLSYPSSSIARCGAERPAPPGRPRGGERACRSASSAPGRGAATVTG
jgi:hypothetical protein